MSIDLKRLSKKMAHALRHAPERYGLVLQDEGWVNVDDLVAALRKTRRDWRGLTASHFLKVIEVSDKPRYEIRKGKIRALHGHSVPIKISYEPCLPPQFLYHGTSDQSVEIILREGLKPMNRQYVHLSVDESMADSVGRRKKGKVIILKIKAAEAHEDGIEFYQANDAVWLAATVPAKFITTLPMKK